MTFFPSWEIKAKVNQAKSTGLFLQINLQKKVQLTSYLKTRAVVRVIQRYDSWSVFFIYQRNSFDITHTRTGRDATMYMTLIQVVSEGS